MIKFFRIDVSRFEQLQYLVAQHVYYYNYQLNLIKTNLEYYSMLTFFMRARVSQLAKFSDSLPFEKNYLYYDQLINEFKESGGQLSTSTMITFLNVSVPKITRRQNYAPILTNIFKSSVPHFIENFNFYQQKSLLYKILLIYQNLNIHRKQIFNLIQKSIHSHKPHLKNYIQYYFTMVDLHHKQNPQLKKIIKSHLFNQVTHPKFIQRNPYENNHLLSALTILNSMLKDHEINLQQSQLVINSIEKNIFPSLKNVSLVKNDVAKNFALAKELIYFHKLKIENDQFYELLDSALVFFIDQKMQLSNPVTKRQNFNIELKEGKKMQFRGSRTTQNKNQINHGISSIFETIFSRCLDQLGYDYEKNAFIGMFEYDFVIKGKKSKKYQPFEGMDVKKEIKPISKEEWESFKEMDEFNKIKIKQEWKQAMILNLNGPYHYIDSDVYGNERVTRTDEVKMMLLINYGYKRFNQVYYADWEEIHEKGVYVEEYIKQLMSRNLVFRE